MAKKHLYLPKLADANVAEPKQSGHWEAQEKRIIRAISDGIEVAAEAQNRVVSSVPDAYARPLTFQGALGNPGHPLHERVTQEWRGLLSLLALHRVKPDLNKVTFQPVRFNGGRFARALTNLAPRAVQLQQAPAEKYRWTDFLLIKYDGVTLGAFSPTTLVFTSADYNQKLRDKPFPLKDAQGYLCPPPAANREDLESVGKWAQWLKQEFAALANNAEGAAAEDAVRVLNGELDDWQRSMHRSLGLPGSAAFEAPEYEIAPEPLAINDADFLGPRAIYQLLLRPLQRNRNATGGNVSDYALEVAAGRLPEHLAHVIVIEANLLSQDLKLWPGIRPTELGPDPIRNLFREASGTRINNTDIGKDKGLWIRPELFFLTSTLTKTSGPGRFLSESEERANGGSSRYLLPLRKEILQFFTVDDVLERLKPSYVEENDRVVFSMRLPLRSGRTIEIKKAYSVRGAIQGVGEGVVVEREVPVLELFPNYMGEFWARYYLLFSDTERLAARPVHYGTRYFYLADRVQRLDTPTERLKAELTRISGVDCFPEGIELSERGGQPIGLVVVEKNRDSSVASFRGTAIVGVDFGTSNTNVFTWTSDQAEPEPLTLRFKSNYLRSLLASEATQREKFAQAFFVPVRDIKMPTPTALREYTPGVRKDLLLDYFLYFPDQYRYPDNVLVDLKWEEESTSNLNDYLEALVFVVMVDLVRQRIGRIEFRCTYPKSFNKTRESDYRSKWSSTLHGLFARDGHPEELQDGQKLLYGPENDWSDEPGKTVTLTTRSGKLSVVQEPKFTTEGIAAGEFFSSDKTVRRMEDRANKAGGSICIDVGGGTTDYSLWFGNEIKYDASVLLAGRQVAEVMARNPRIGDTLLSSDDAKAALREAKGPKFASRMNYILRKEHKEISANLARVSNVRDVVQLRRVLVVEFGALAFYAGHLALALNAFLGGGFASSVQLSGLSLHWGGNASKMLDWIDHGKFKPDGIAAQFLNNLFASVVMGEVAPERERFDIEYAHLHQKQSVGQKNEAAGGVVVIDNIERAGAAAAKPASEGFILPGRKAKASTMEGVVMGEEITVGETLLPYQLLTDPNGTLFQGHTSLFRDAGQSQLDYFLEALNAIGESNGFLPAGEQITLSPQERMAIRNNLRNDFARLASQEPSQRNIEPVFIMEVRYLLSIMLEKML